MPSEQQDGELAACPMCKANTLRVSGNRMEAWQVMCISCGLLSGGNQTYEGACAAWNRRPLESALSSRLAEVERRNKALIEVLEQIEHDEHHGCLDGDCPHDHANGCIMDLRKLIRDRADESRCARLDNPPPPFPAQDGTKT